MSTVNHVTNLVSIGWFAREVSVLPSTVHYCVKEGLLQITGHKPDGFFLFDRESALKRIERIQSIGD